MYGHFCSQKLDGVGPVDTRPSTDKLHHIVKKNKNKKMWHVTRDMWHMTGYMFGGGGGGHSLKISAP